MDRQNNFEEFFFSSEKIYSNIQAKTWSCVMITMTWSSTPTKTTLFGIPQSKLGRTITFLRYYNVYIPTPRSVGTWNTCLLTIHNPYYDSLPIYVEKAPHFFLHAQERSYIYILEDDRLHLQPPHKKIWCESRKNCDDACWWCCWADDEVESGATASQQWKIYF